MIWTPELVPAIFLRRYKRFFADIEINGKVEVAHVPNTGSLLGCLSEGAECRVRPQTNPDKKLKHTLELVKTPTSWVGVNTSNPPKLVSELIQSQLVDAWQKFNCWQWEVAISKETRLDLVLWNDPAAAGGETSKKTRKSFIELTQNYRPHFIEIKNVTLAEGTCAMFPDCETTRGQKHIRELSDLISQGFSAEMVYVIQRSDCTSFHPAEKLDPIYSQLLFEARRKGLKVSPFMCSFRSTELEMSLNPDALPTTF